MIERTTAVLATPACHVTLFRGHGDHFQSQAKLLYFYASTLSFCMTVGLVTYLSHERSVNNASFFRCPNMAWHAKDDSNTSAAAEPTNTNSTHRGSTIKETFILAPYSAVQEHHLCTLHSFGSAAKNYRERQISQKYFLFQLSYLIS